MQDFTTVGMFDLHMKLNDAVKFLGGCSDSASHRLFHPLFSEMEKADFFEPLNVSCLNQELFGKVKGKKSLAGPAV